MSLDGLVANATWAHTNVYGAGKMLATYDNVGLHFHFADWLGTNRVQMNADGTVEETCLSLPFGDSLSCSGPGTDATEHHFTGKERDAESGLDYFGARYFGSNTGRWMSPDWAAKAEPIPYAKMDWPQSFNLYGYVENNPLSVADADGHTSDADCKEDATKCEKKGESQSKSDQIRKGTQNTGTSTEKAIPAQQQKLEVVPTKNSTASRPEVNFHLAQPSAHGGIIVQEIKTADAAGQQTSHYWEAWPVFKGSQGTAYLERGVIDADDHFVNTPGEHVTASARYYDGSKLEDGGFKTPGGPGTYAGQLPATATNPNLPTSNATAPVDRTFTAP